MDISTVLRTVLAVIQALMLLLGVCLCSPVRVREPKFNPTPKKVSYKKGDTARLFCSVKHLGERTVVWRKWSELNPLTIGMDTWIGDQRISVDHGESPSQWDLVIDAVSMRDAGQYECQISMKRKTLRHNVSLIVSDIQTGQTKRNPEIIITGTQYVRIGDDVSLYCNASLLGNRRRQLVWLKDAVTISTQGAHVLWDYIPSLNREILSTHLRIYRAQPNDTGVYTCRSTDNKLSTSAHVTVLNGGSNNVKRAGSVSQEVNYAVLSVECTQTNCTFLMFLFLVHVLIT